VIAERSPEKLPSGTTACDNCCSARCTADLSRRLIMRRRRLMQGRDACLSGQDPVDDFGVEHVGQLFLQAESIEDEPLVIQA